MTTSRHTTINSTGITSLVCVWRPRRHHKNDRPRLGRQRRQVKLEEVTFMMRCYGRRPRSDRQASCCSSSSTSPSSWSNILDPSRQSINRYSSVHHCNDQYSLFEYWLVPAGCVMKANTIYRIITNDASRRLSATRPCRPSLCISGPCRVNYLHAPQINSILQQRRFGAGSYHCLGPGDSLASVLELHT
jgi:hypothetical protein